MTPEFAEFTDPIFLHVFSRLDRFGRNDLTSVEDERRLLTDLFEQQEKWLHGECRRLRQENEVEKAEALLTSMDLAKYALIALIDELFIFGPDWPGKQAWEQQPFELQHTGQATALRYNQFFEKATEAADHTKAGDAVETFFVCVMLGFKGRLRDSAEEAVQWTQEFGNYVKNIRLKQQNDRRDSRTRSRIVTAKPLWNRPLVIAPWTIGTVLSALVILRWLIRAG